MRLSKKTVISVNDVESNIIGHMTYAARKLWNVCNYERHNYKDLDLEQAPSWYSQKKTFKDNLWFKSLPSQTAQEVCKVLDKSWKSFYALKKSGGIENPQPPRYKQENIPTYIQNGLRKQGDEIRLTISKAMKTYMLDAYAIDVDYLYLRNPCFTGIENIKQIKLYPPENGRVDVIIVYEIPDAEPLPDNGKYLSIDLGVHNLMTCYSTEGSSFILGREYFSIARKYDKEIARVQSQWSQVQSIRGVKYPKSSKHIKKLFAKKNNCLNDYLHKLTHWLTKYCADNDIHTVVLGDLTGVREDNDMGRVENQKFHALPYQKIRTLLSYKLAMQGITLIMQKEMYSSQCSPLTSEVSKAFATKEKRVFRGLYKDGTFAWNADVVGAYNILRLYLQSACRPFLLVRSHKSTRVSDVRLWDIIDATDCFFLVLLRLDERQNVCSIGAGESPGSKLPILDIRRSYSALKRQPQIRATGSVSRTQKIKCFFARQNMIQWVCCPSPIWQQRGGENFAKPSPRLLSGCRSKHSWLLCLQVA